MADARINQDGGAGSSNQERVNVPGPGIWPGERPREALVFGLPLHLVARALVIERQGRPPVAEGNDFDAADVSGPVRHVADPIGGPGRIRTRDTRVKRETTLGVCLDVRRASRDAEIRRPDPSPR
jgi:hypothetical protein